MKKTIRAKVARVDLWVALSVLGSIFVLVLVLSKPEPVKTSIAGYSVGQRPIVVHEFGSGPNVGLMLIASIHGNEPAGTPLVEEFLGWLKRNRRSVGDKRVVIVPTANPDGYAAGLRLNSSGVDLNRNFLADNRINRARFGESGLSEPEARVLHSLVEKLRPEAIVSIHQPVACIDYDGPGQPLAEAMAAVCDLPVRKLGSKPGSLGSYFGETLGRPIITLELPRDPVDPWNRYGPCLKAALAFVHQ